MYLIRLLYLAVALMATCSSYKILVFSPMISKSHMISNGRIADELAKAGHQVVLFEPEFLPIANYNNSAYAQRIVVPGFSAVHQNWVNVFGKAIFSRRSVLQRIQGFIFWHTNMATLCSELLEKSEYLEKLRSYNFDIYIGEQLTLCGTGLMHALGIKTHLWVSSCPLMDHMSWILGIPMPLSYVPSVGDTSISDKPNYLERLENIVVYCSNVFSFRVGSKMITNLYRKHFGEQFPDVDDLARNSSLILVSTDELVDFPRPITHNVIYIGGLGLPNPKPLKSPFSEYVKKGKKGVVLISFGSIITTKNMPPSFIQNIVDVIQSFPQYHFIFKMDEGDEANAATVRTASNVDVVEWAPQLDLLGHPRLKAFVTHGGYNSLFESARSGIPIVTIPGFVDQHRNARAAERNGWGIALDKLDLMRSSKYLKDALTKILFEERYAKQARRMAKLLRTKPFTAAERLVKCVKFVAENDGILPELQIEGRQLNFFIYHNLDIFIPFAFFVVLVFYVSLKFMRIVVENFCYKTYLSAVDKPKRE